MAGRKHRKSFRKSAQKRAVGALSRYSRTLFFFAIAFSSVVIFMSSRLLRNARKPVQLYMKLVDKEFVLESEDKVFWDQDHNEDLVYVQNSYGVHPAPERYFEKKKPVSEGVSFSQNILMSDHENVVDLNETLSRDETNDLNATFVCQKSSMYLLVLIFSEHPMTSLRNLIRHTWCKRKVYSNNRRMTCMFLIGQHAQSSVFSDQVEQEAASYNDVILTSVYDDVRNSTAKLKYGMKWLISNCKHFRYILKTEDDVIINMNMMMENILIKFPETGFAGGKCTNRIPVRNKLSKYYVSVEEYQEEEFPLICNNMGYILSNDIFNKLYETMPDNNHQIPLDDIFIGVLLHQLNIIPRNLTNFVYGKSFQMKPNSSDDVICTYVIIHIHVNTESNAEKLWDAISRQCARS